MCSILHVVSYSWVLGSLQRCFSIHDLIFCLPGRAKLNTFSQTLQSWLQVIKSEEIFTAMQGWCWPIPVKKTRIHTLLNNGTLFPVQNGKFTWSFSKMSLQIKVPFKLFQEQMPFPWTVWRSSKKQELRQTSVAWRKAGTALQKIKLKKPFLTCFYSQLK